MREVKKLLFPLLCLGLLALLTLSTRTMISAKESGENLLQNPGFEEKGETGFPKGWQIIPAYDGKGEATLDDQNAYAGKYSLRLKPNKKNTSEAFGVYMMLDPKKVQGKEVTISGFAKQEGLGDNAAGILFKTDKENYAIISKAQERKFIPDSKTFRISQSIPEAGVLILVQGTKGTVWFDDLSLTVSEGGSMTMSKTEEALPKPSEDEQANRINTLGWQDSVFISPDGQELYFAYLPYVQKDFMNLYFGKISEKDIKSRGPIRTGSHGKMNFETYKVVRNRDGSWSRPVNLNINSTYSLYSAKLSFDGKELYYALRDNPGGYGADDIYVSKRLPDWNWSPPENLGPNINTKFREDTPCLTSDGKTLYFARNKGETYGWEIWVSQRGKGEWSKPEKLGPPINEPNPEKTANYQPFISADGKEFYFTSVQQLYKSVRQPDGGWSKPEKVFPQLPASGHGSMTSEGRYLYFLAAKDKASLQREHWTIWYAERKKDGTWGEPKLVD